MFFVPFVATFPIHPVREAILFRLRAVRSPWAKHGGRILLVLFLGMVLLGNRGVKPLLQFIMPFLNSSFLIPHWRPSCHAVVPTGEGGCAFCGYFTNPWYLPRSPNGYTAPSGAGMGEAEAKVYGPGRPSFSDLPLPPHQGCPNKTEIISGPIRIWLEVSLTDRE